MKKNKSTQTCTYSVNGMHCQSCEMLIEEKLKNTKGVSSATASTSSGEVTIKYSGKKPSPQQLSQLFKDEGYKFLSQQKQKISAKEILMILGISAIVIGLFVLLERLGLGSLVNVNANSALPAFFLLGLVAGSSSCAALTSGLVLSMSKKWATSDTPGIRPHIWFNVGRFVAYSALGAILGSLGSVFQLSSSLNTVITFILAGVMIVLAFQMLELDIFRRIKLPLPQFKLNVENSKKNTGGIFGPITIGLMTVFLPCGFTFTVETLALASGSIVTGTLMMALFAFGTIIPLLIIGFTANKFMSKPKLSRIFSKVAGILVLLLALYNINAQLGVLGLPNLSGSIAGAATKTSNYELPPIINGKQIIKMSASARGYSPNSFTVRVGVPVVWEITNAGVSGCTGAIIAEDFFPGQVKIDQNVVTKEFTPTKTGTYQFSCWMRMVYGSIKVVEE